MISLDSTSLSLQAVLAGAVSTNQPDATFFFYDVPAQTKPGFEEYREGVKRTALNSATDVTVCAAPGYSGTTRKIHGYIYNKDTASVTVTLKTDDGTTEFIICKQVLAAGETLIVDRNGNISVLGV